MKIVWYCPNCNWVCVSDSKFRHCLDKCKCGRCFMDLEEEYCRIGGNPIRLSTFDKGKWIRNRK